MNDANGAAEPIGLRVALMDQRLGVLEVRFEGDHDVLKGLVVEVRATLARMEQQITTLTKGADKTGDDMGAVKIDAAERKGSAKWPTLIAVALIGALVSQLAALAVDALKPRPPIVAPAGDGNLTPGGQYAPVWRR